MFQVLVLRQLYNLSDDQIEYQIRDRLSFMRFLDFGVEDPVPDAKTVWLYREKLAQAGMVKALFDKFDAYLRDNGYLAMGGQVVDASIVSVPIGRNSREENEAVKAGKTPKGWNKRTAQEAAQGCGCTLDEEAWQKPFWLQEPYQCGQAAQADP